MEAVIFDVLGKLAPGKSASSEEVARAADNENWRRLTGHVRNTARGLARQGKIVITRHGMLEVASHQACVMLGYTAQELQGRPARILYASDADYALVGDRVRAEVAAHGAFDGDICFMRKDGSRVWARVQGRGVRPEEVHGGTVWILEDITAAREAQVQQSWGRAHDALTQLYNRAAFDERLGQLMAERSARQRAVVPAADEEGGEGEG